MSSLTECNYCTLKGLERTLRRGYKITLVHRDTPEFVSTDPELAKYACAGVDVFEHPKTEPPLPKYKIAWFMELTDTCCC